LFPYLKSFKNKTDNPNTIEYKIGEIFGELKNKVQSGYTLRDVLDIIDGMSFKTQDQKHELSALYENRIAQMGNAGRNGGEYYTPRPLIQTMIKAIKPQLRETIYDGACGSAGFLVESFDYLKNNNELTAKDFKILQEKTFYGKELKSLAYIIAVMNMILHGIEAPNIEHTNTLQENILNYSEKDKVDIVLANPPFGGSMRAEIKEQFPIKSGETAYLFMQHFMKKLKTGGRAAIVIKNTFLSNSDTASIDLRKELLSKFNLDTILDLPGGVFQGAGVKTVVLFFRKGEPTRDIWYYQLNLERNIGKGTPLSETDMAEFLALRETKSASGNSWNISINDIDTETFDLSVKNPNKKEETALRQPQEILEEMKALDKESADIISSILELI
jgi:type I restriction enzyme M protein